MFNWLWQENKRGINRRYWGNPTNRAGLQGHREQHNHTQQPVRALIEVKWGQKSLARDPSVKLDGNGVGDEKPGTSKMGTTPPFQRV